MPPRGDACRFTNCDASHFMHRTPFHRRRVSLQKWRAPLDKVTRAASRRLTSDARRFPSSARRFFGKKFLN